MRYPRFYCLCLAIVAVNAATAVFAQTRIHTRAEASWKRGSMIGVSRMSSAATRSRCNRRVLVGRVVSVALNDRQELAGFVLETKDAGNPNVQLAKTLYDELPMEAEAALPQLLARGKGVRVTAYRCKGRSEAPEADEIRALQLPPAAGPRAPTPTDLTGASDSELRRHLGETVTMRGVFSLRGKVGPLILVDGRPIYLESARRFSWGESYAKMEGKEVGVTGTLRFAHYSHPRSSKALPVGQATDHFYFDADTAKVELIEAPTANDQTRGVHIGEEFTLNVGQESAIEGERLRLRFVSVEEDSRCPSDVACVWAGNAKLLLQVSSGNKSAEKLRLNTHGSAQGADEGKVGSLRVKLLKLDPYPRSNQRIAAGDYRATLVVSRE